MKTIKGLIIVFIVLCKSVQNSKGITTVSQLNDNGNLETYCVTKNQSETLSWITPYNASFYNLKTNMTSDISKFVNNDWLLEYSYQSYLGPVVDPRWQNFETFVSKNNVEANKYLKEKLKDSFELTFSLKYIEDSEMLFYYYKSLKHILTFKNNILTSKICPDKTSVSYCSNYINITENLQLYANYTSWNHFSIRYNKHNNRFNLLINNVYIQNETIPNYALNRITVKSTKGAIMKLHIYEYYRTDSDTTEILLLENVQFTNNKLCMSGYFYFDAELTIQIRQYSTIIKEDTFTNDKIRWKFIKIEGNVQEYTVKRYTFWLKYRQQSAILFSHIKINSDCDTDVNKIYTEFMVNKIEKVACESLNHPSSSIRMGNRNEYLESACAKDEFGNDCIKCKAVFNTDICQETLTCADTNKCYCQPGYHGKSCKQKCDKLNKNVFGSNCNKQCGHCMDNKQCHHITGQCLNGCEKYFLEPFCNENYLKIVGLHGIWNEDVILTMRWKLFKDVEDKKRVFQISHDRKDVAFFETPEKYYKVHSALICPPKKQYVELGVRTKIDENVFEWSRVEVACPPPPPTFGNNPIVAIPFGSSVCSFKLQLPPFQNPTNRSYISIFVEQMDYDGTKDNCDPKKLGLKTSFGLRSIHLAVHMEIRELNEMLIIAIGEFPTKESFSKLLNCSYSNALLSLKEKSTFYVVMTSADDGLTVKRSTLYVVPVASIDDFRISSKAA